MYSPAGVGGHKELHVNTTAVTQTPEDPAQIQVKVGKGSGPLQPSLKALPLGQTCQCVLLGASSGALPV